MLNDHGMCAMDPQKTPDRTVYIPVHNARRSTMMRLAATKYMDGNKPIRPALHANMSTVVLWEVLVIVCKSLG